MRVLPWLLLTALALLAGCERVARNMYDQPRREPLEPSAFFADGASARAPLPGTLAQSSGTLAGTSSGRAGTDNERRQAAAERAQALPDPITLELLRRGRERYTIYCTPCHSPLGDGDGFVTRRGFPHPPSYHSARLRAAPDRHFYDVIRNGYGAMYPYADRVAPTDRWAIVAYIRALQRSQHAPLADAPAPVQARLRGQR